MNNIFLSVLGVSATAGIVILLVLLLEPLLNKRYAAKWKYWIWALLAIRLIIPFNINLAERQIKVKIPVQMTVPLTNDKAETVFPAPDSGGTVVISRGETHNGIGEQKERKPVSISLLDIVSVVWLIGFLTVVSVHLLSYMNYRKRLARHGIHVSDEELFCMLQELSDELHIKCKVSVIEYVGAVSPMIIGFLKPALVLPQERYSREELYFILKHELIHLKRHDVHFKLLLTLAGAIHWFNPFVWVMQKEGTVDMELSCDERVVQGADYAVRKAYTETLLSTLHRRCKEKTVLSTQFYGTAQVMKKRFYNILVKTKKKNGILLICTVVLMLCMGMLIGCSEVGASLNVPDAGILGDNVPEENNKQDVQDSEFPGADEGSPAQEEKKEEAPAPVEEVLSADALEVKAVSEALAAAYFDKDKDAIESYLTNPYEWDMDVYEGAESGKGAGEVSIIELKGLSEIGEKSVEDTCVVSVEFSDTQYDRYFYLTVELKKEPDGWRVYFYGLEG